MNTNLTLVRALPQAGGCMSSLPAERNETQPRKTFSERMAEAMGCASVSEAITKIQAGATPFERTRNPRDIAMKAPYFQEPEEEPLPKIETIEELAKKYLAAHEGLV